MPIIFYSSLNPIPSSPELLTQVKSSAGGPVPKVLRLLDSNQKDTDIQIFSFYAKIHRRAESKLLRKNGFASRRNRQLEATIEQSSMRSLSSRQSILQKAFSGELTSPPSQPSKRRPSERGRDPRRTDRSRAAGGGWGVVADSRVRRETICPGRIEGAGRRGKPEIADYVLTFRNHKLAVIEAKARDKATPKASGRPRPMPKSCRRASPIPPTAGASTGSTWRPARRAMSSAIRRRTSCGPSRSRSRTHGATASPPCRSRTAAAPGRRATTSTTPSRTRWRRSPPASSASC